MGDKLEQDIVERIKERAAPDGGETVTLSTSIKSLGIQSLELTEIIFDIEEAYGIQVEINTVDAWSRLKNVEDIVVAVRALVDAKQGRQHAPT